VAPKLLAWAAGGNPVRRSVSAQALLPAPVNAALGCGSRYPWGANLPPLPNGFVFLVDTDGAFLTDADGAYLIEAA
jgi:hypothetical protein